MSNKTKTGIAVFIAVTILSIAIAYLIFGARGLFQIIKITFYFLLFLSVFALIVWLVWFLFIKKQRFDATAVNKAKLIMAGKVQCPPQIKNRSLRLSGDKGHSWFEFGKIIGYLQIQVLIREQATDQKGNPQYEDINGKKIPKYVFRTEPQDIFIVKTQNKLPFSLFEEPKVVRVNPKDHTELIGDVTLFGLNLIPVSEYWYLSKDYLDARKIDMAILREAERGVLFEMLKDTKSIIDQAIDLDSKHRKVIEEKHLVEVPQLQKIGLQ